MTVRFSKVIVPFSKMTVRFSKVHVPFPVRVTGVTVVTASVTVVTADVTVVTVVTAPPTGRSREGLARCCFKSQAGAKVLFHRLPTRRRVRRPALRGGQAYHRSCTMRLQSSSRAHRPYCSAEHSLQSTLSMLTTSCAVAQQHGAISCRNKVRTHRRTQSAQWRRCGERRVQITPKTGIRAAPATTVCSWRAVRLDVPVCRIDRALFEIDRALFEKCTCQFRKCTCHFRK